MKIEAENLELILQNENGDTAIIPVKYRQKALDYLHKGQHDKLDKLISNLPSMENYAEDGSIVYNTNPPEGDKDKEELYAGPSNYPINKNLYEKGYTVTADIPEDFGFGDTEGMRKLASDWRWSYGTDIEGNRIAKPPKFVSSVKDKYSRYQQAPNPYSYINWETNESVAGQHCLGSACRASKQFNPSLPTIYDVLGRQLGIVQETTEGETGVPSLDSWEVHQKLEDTGTGTILFNKGLQDKDREKYIQNFDPSQLPLGTIFGHGEATGTEHLPAGAKSYRGKKENMPRHSSTLVKFDENTGDMLIYDYGKIRRVAYNRELTEEEKAENAKQKSYEDPKYETWNDFAKRENLVYATKINQAGDWTYSKLKGYKSERERKKEEPIEMKTGEVKLTE